MSVPVLYLGLQSVGETHPVTLACCYRVDFIHESMYLSGKNAQRPGLKRALRRLKRGDVLVVRKLDRLGRSVRDLITLVSELQDRGIHFRSLTDSIDTSTPAGRFFFHVMSALAEMERELIIERTRAGLAAAREQGRIGGRRRIMTTEVVQRCRRMLENGATRQQVANVIGVGAKTIYKYFPVASLENIENQ
ncbi:recombinase family protein [Klebsiella aerogenes]|uniref:recombinase family protein n=1 Tax=Klebsiella aerogenes TaxID=548 RepID=UPI003A811AD7